jgi:osmotically-inducible protein OsmY
MQSIKRFLVTANSMRNFFAISSIILCSVLLSSCWEAATTAVAGGFLVYKRHAVENFANDERIKSEINNAYFQVPQIWDQNHIVVSSVNGYVLLAGEARTAEIKQQAVALAKKVSGVARVYDNISIAEPVSFFQQTKDSALTAIIKTKMFFAENFDPSGVKVITIDNVVYVLGVVTLQQSDQAADIASRTAGVTKVVKVFQYIT